MDARYAGMNEAPSVAPARSNTAVPIVTGLVGGQSSTHLSNSPLVFRNSTKNTISPKTANTGLRRPLYMDLSGKSIHAGHAFQRLSSCALPFTFWVNPTNLVFFAHVEQ